MKEIIEILCGEWVYPHKGSGKRITYPITEPLVGYFGKKTKVSLDDSKIGAHLRGPCVIIAELTYEPGPRAFAGEVELRLMMLEDKSEPSRLVSLDYVTKRYQLGELARCTDYVHLLVNKERLAENPNGICVLFADVMLAEYLAGKDLPRTTEFEILFEPAEEGMIRCFEEAEQPRSHWPENLEIKSIETKKSFCRLFQDLLEKERRKEKDR